MEHALKNENFPSLNNVAPPPAAAEVFSSETLDNLYPALVECFGIILLGYLAGSFSFITEAEAKGMSTFVGKFSLPALIFSSLCTLDLATMNLTLLLAIFVSKSIVFFAVLGVTLVICRGESTALGKAGLYAIFVTQSNDFALGLPILKSLYQKTNPQLPMYLYLLAPVNLLFLNPLGFVMMEVGKHSSSRNTKLRMVFNVAWAIVTNPIIYMSVLGMLFGSLVFKGQPLPPVMHNFLETLGNAFSASALFLLGLHMVGRVRRLSPSLLMVPMLLVAAKNMILPLIAREVTSICTNVTQLSDFAFLYGTFPSAPSVFVFALQYDIFPDMVASAMVVSTVVSAPVMFISAQLLMLSAIDPTQYVNSLKSFMFDVCILTTLATVWTLLVLVASRSCKLRSQTLLLLMGQLSLSVGAVMWSRGVGGGGGGWTFYLQYGFFAYGMYSSRINAALLAVTMVLKGETATKVQPCFALAGGLLPLLLLVVVVLLASSGVVGEAKMNPFFQYGAAQATTSLVVLVASLLVVVVCLVVVVQRRRSRAGWWSSERQRLISSAASAVVEGEEEEEAALEESRDDEPTNSHVVLLVSLSLTMFVGIAVCAWMLLTDVPTGLFLLLLFTDGFGSLGQGLISFFVFGLRSKQHLFVPVVLGGVCRRLVYGRRQLVVRPWEDLEAETRTVCRQFSKHHLCNCAAEIAGGSHRGEFRGCDLVDWLVEMGLAADRQSGVKYGRHLVRGRVVRHVDGVVDFYDDDFVYTFQSGDGG